MLLVSEHAIVICVQLIPSAAHFHSVMATIVCFSTLHFFLSKLYIIFSIFLLSLFSTVHWSNIPTYFHCIACPACSACPTCQLVQLVKQILPPLEPQLYIKTILLLLQSLAATYPVEVPTSQEQVTTHESGCLYEQYTDLGTNNISYLGWESSC